MDLFNVENREDAITCIQRGDDINQQQPGHYYTPFQHHCCENNAEIVMELVH